MSKPVLEFKIVNPLVGDKFPVPHYATVGAAGMDLRACIAEPLLLKAQQTVLIPTGIAIHVGDANHAAIILPRSGLGHKHGIILGNTVGLIDSDYQGELMISCWNRSSHDYEVQPGERIAQLVILPVTQVALVQVDSFSEASVRGEGGFGHTGQH